MKRLQSITFLLLALTSLSVALLVSVFSLSAKDAYDEREAASRLVTDIAALQNMLKAEELVLLAQGRFGLIVEAKGSANSKSMSEIEQLRREIRSSVEAATKSPSPDQVVAVRNVLNTYSALENIWAKSLSALNSSDENYRANLSTNSMLARRNFVAALETRSNLLAGNLDGDAVISEMMKIKNIAVKIREDTGSGRRAVVGMITAATRPTAAQLAEVAEIDGRINAPWAAITADIDLPVMSPALRDIIAKTNKTYFGEYRKLRQQIIDRLSGGNPPNITASAWLLRTDTQVNDITEVAATALSRSYEHVTDQLTTAQRNFYIAIGLMGLSLSLALLTTIVVVTRIIRPLHVIAKTMEIVADGNLEHRIPYKDRADEIGRFARALKTFRDNAREKQHIEAELLQNQIAKDSAEASNRIKTEFLANMSHELRTPLNAVIGFSDIMRQKLFGPLTAQYEEYAGLIHESGQLLLNLVSDILDIAKIEAGKFTLDFQNINLEQEVDSCVRLVKKRAQDRHITLTTQLKDAKVDFVADRRAFKQILLNLLSNAVKFTGDGGRVEIICKVNGGSLEIIVRDNGIGIPASALSRIGHAFEQASNNPTYAREGTGLGLALVRALSEQHGGKLRIESTEHVGTTVTVELPLSQAERLAA